MAPLSGPADDLYRQYFECTGDAFLIIEGDVFVDCNQATVEMLRYRTRDELLQTHPSQLSPEFQSDGRRSFDKANEMMAVAAERGSHRFEWEHKRADGEVFPVEVLLTAVSAADRPLLHVVWRDLTERRRLEDHLVYLSRHDSLTGLANRSAFDDALARLDECGPHPIGVLMLDLDDLKRINDERGHSAGDAMLRRVADVLRFTFRTGDVVARIGGDEFAVLTAGRDAAAIEVLAMRLQEAWRCTICRARPPARSACRWGWPSPTPACRWWPR